MTAPVSYNARVRQRFAEPQHAGDLEGRFDDTLTACASASDQGARVQLTVGLEDGLIGAATFRAWGCPHLIAAADLVCERLPGKSVQSLENVDLAHITEQLCIPVEKAGRILLIEDALAMLGAQDSNR
ncbi:MAG: iron-sulfur cluster assembly scaffold protein [Woeseiaceae bacterium]|nr:iron-sulfur cluster assembly scaffold protein [Woeseiaceae bacterium]